MDEARFNECYAAYQQQVRYQAYGLLRHVEDVEDVSQIVWMRAWTSEVREESIKGWLSVVTHNLCIDLLRYRQRRHIVDLETLLAHVADTDVEEQTMCRLRLQHALASLDAKTVRRLLRAALANYDIPIGTRKIHLVRGRARAQAALAEEDAC